MNIYDAVEIRHQDLLLDRLRLLSPTFSLSLCSQLEVEELFFLQSLPRGSGLESEMKNTDVKFERSKMTKKKSLVIIPPVAASKNMSFVRHAIVAVISRSFLVSVLPCIWGQMCLLSKVSCGCANSALPSVSGKSKNS